MHPRLTALLLSLLVVLAAGCSETVDPVLGTEQAFTLYGYLDPTAERQAVRVFPIDGRLERYTEPVAIDADVRSTAVATGATQAWRDSTVLFRDGTYGHVFHVPFTPPYGTTFRLTVARSDGAVSEVTVQTPPDVTPERLAPVLFPTPKLRIAYPGAPRLNEIIARYTIDGIDAAGNALGNVQTYTFRHDGVQERVADGWMVPVPFLEDAQAMTTQYWASGRPFGALLALHEVEVEVLISSSDWFSPVGVYDAELLVQPGVFSNVENGFGFVGAGYRRSVAWLPEPGVLAQVGFRPPVEADE